MRHARAATAGEVSPANLATSSTIRLVAYVGMVAAGLVYAVLTARWLGPADKGVLATLTFLAILLSQAACLGLGEAAIVIVGRRQATLQQAASATVGALLPAAAAATVVLAVAASVNFWSDWGDVSPAILAACIGIPAFAASTVLSQVLNIEERFFATSLVALGQAVLTAAATVLLVAVWDLGVLGAVAAMTIGAVAGAVVVVRLLRRHVSLRPRWDRSFLRRALPYGIRVQASGPPPITDRADLVLVYALGGQAAAGRYSIALTIGTMVGLVPLAISHVSFPRLARSSAPAADELAERSCRYGLAAAVAAAVVLAVVTPVLLPVVFGEAYAPAVAPALVLVVAYVFSSAQWLLGRAAAARGNAGILVWSYGANLVVMAGLDFVLIPAFGITGAAVASAAGALVGAAVVANDYRRRGAGLGTLVRFLPRVADFRVLARIPRAALPRAAPPAAVVPPPPE